MSPLAALNDALDEGETLSTLLNELHELLHHDVTLLVGMVLVP